jgi:hypothetical protein
MSHKILSLLAHTKSIPKFSSLENENKLQQVLAILVSKNCVCLTHMDFTHNLFNILLGLQNNKYKQLWLKSTVILYQILALLINDLEENSLDAQHPETKTTQKPPEDKLTIFITFIGDLVKIVKADKPTWLLEMPDQFLVLQILS